MKIIWDFDGVIADSERIWVENRRKLLKEMGIVDWDSETAFRYMGGISNETRKIRLKELGIDIPDEFWHKSREINRKAIENGDIRLTADVLPLIERFNGKQCLATGGSVQKTILKIQSTGLGEYFTQKNTFNSSMVAHGKPAPDIFLYAVGEMGWEKDECIIIEDSIAGIQAGIASGIKTIAYIGNWHLDKDKYIQEIKSVGNVKIFDDMISLSEYINSL